VSLLFGLVTIQFAARDFVGELSSGVLPFDAAGDFSLSTTEVRFLNGNLAFRISTGDAGSESIVGESGTMSGTGTLTTEANLETLSIPINASFRIPVGDTTTVNLELTGELVATAMLQDGQPGDFNRDGVVDAADYVVWRNGLGTTYVQADYNLWRAHFGRSPNSTSVQPASESISAAVPEPSMWMLILAAGLAISPRQSIGKTCPDCRNGL
jgi:hypothetical protein